jgi:hypothetical protein
LRLKWKGPPAQPNVERVAFDELQHERGRSAVRLESVDGGDVRMIERRKHLGLAFEPAQPLGIVCQRRWQDLDSHIAPQLRIAGAVDLAHSAAAEQFDDLVRSKRAPVDQRHPFARRS